MVRPAPHNKSQNNAPICSLSGYDERVDRRMFLSGALGITAAALAGCAPQPSATAKVLPPTVAPPLLPPTEVSAVAQIDKIAYPGGPLFGLPGEGNMMAWTVDDGADLNAINAYADFAEETGNRIVFFILGSYPTWAQAAPRLAPLVQTGQIQIANHTYGHSSFTSSTAAQIQQELLRNDQIIQDLFGIDPKPWYRPPYGHRDARTDAAAASVGYTAPVMWFGTLGDAARKTPQEIVSLANQYFQPQRVVIGHANYTGGVTEVFPELNQIIVDRGLMTVTLNDVFAV
jgi:peptidoglycan/xylan/chitin deacetylase (PgdA/CDA1 family)